MINVDLVYIKAPVTAAVLKDMREENLSIAVSLLTKLTL